MTQFTAVFNLVNNASLIVQVLMGLLLAISILSWFYIFRKFLMLRRARKQAAIFETEFYKTTSLTNLHQGTLANRHTIGGMERIFSAGMQAFSDINEKDCLRAEAIEYTQRAMKAAYQRELDALEADLPFLASIGSVSPYIGLLGTVWGIMNAFIGLSNTEQSTLASVAPGIAEALIATALGLFAAIPAVLAYNRYVAEVDRLALRYESFVDDFSNTLQVRGLA
ncbi:protein TolQ [Hydromonas duriensis]|uniref:Cell division and transport-associated protein TolQ n=1 Tax=Hydromonas duriensis TaxID=1527608 RepID=A0A4R6YBX4_9BURK|nr:protein TolQ [Hydromonas duriensis]TDR33176.1 cell division and transport-associated protein TolQ [Hydromonas duriensis]